MTRFELRISGAGSDRSTNCATRNARTLFTYFAFSICRVVFNGI